MVPYEREFKRWAGDTSASVWRDTKIELPDYTPNYTNGIMMSEVVSMLFARQWTFCLPFEDLKKVNSVLLLQSFRKTLYNWIFYDNPRVEYITENLCWELKYFDMRVPVSRKDAKLYFQNFKEVFKCTYEVKFDVIYQIMGFPTTGLVKQLDSDFLKWLVCSIRIILTIAKDKKKVNKDSTFLFEYEIDALLLTMLLKNPALTSCDSSDLPLFLFDDIFAKSTTTATETAKTIGTEEEVAKAGEEEAKKLQESNGEKKSEDHKETSDVKGKDRAGDKSKGERSADKKDKKEEKKVKLNIYSMNVGSLFQLATMHFRLFNEIMGTLVSGYLDFIRCFDGSHFSGLYQKLYKNRNKEWANMNEYPINYAIGIETLATEEVKAAFRQAKACLVEGFRGDDIFSKQILVSGGGESKKREDPDNALESASKKLKT